MIGTLTVVPARTELSIWLGQHLLHSFYTRGISVFALWHVQSAENSDLKKLERLIRDEK
jgi:hypothetical protein